MAVLAEERRTEIQTKARAAIDAATLRKDPWWTYPATMGIFLLAMVIYSTWAGAQTSNYYAEPYLSPLYSPCLAANCEHTTFQLLGSWWMLSPFFLVGWLPVGFRVTCYYYRKAYYRSFWFSPPACAVSEPHRSYSGETRVPLIGQNLHRYFWYLMMVNMVFLTWDAGLAFFFEDGFGIGVGSLVFLVMIATMWLYMLSCHSCRHLTGGNLNSFSTSPLRHQWWQLVSRLNKRHGQYALASLLWIPLTDLYVRLLAWGVITDIRLL